MPLVISEYAYGPDWLNPAAIIEQFGAFGFAAVVVIVFIESGLLVGFFLPGDSLLFTAGLFSATHPDSFAPLWLLMACVPVAAILGDQLGYAIGRRAGPAIFSRPESRVFRREHVRKSEAFFAKHGPKTVVLARFVPIVRTFVPVIAGVSRMHYRTFCIFNIIGGIAWGAGLTLLGYVLGDRVPWVRDNLDLVIVLIVAFSVMPVLVEFTRSRRAAARAEVQ
ncbi:VTT domain-containing protein [Hoyosella altamirensis]|uniref:Membrane-associated protein n=1 Tax=Hoyosella altamirensis TaxID=616997 RepID=A0A839RT05_9ACTN|nr:VTT domain-containing protein [Hoyosella altamirensis]MBB3040042.1 membrane-associated protein [Hoyosella altamirensis]